MARRFIGDQAQSAGDQPQLLPPEACIFLVNCLHALHNALSRLEFTGTQIAALAARLEEVMSHLTQIQAAHVLARAGLQGLHDAVENTKTPEVPLAQRGQGCSQAEVQSALVRPTNTFLKVIY